MDTLFPSTSLFRSSLSVALPVACFALPAASLARPFAFSVNSPMGYLLCFFRGVGTRLLPNQRRASAYVPLREASRSRARLIGRGRLGVERTYRSSPARGGGPCEAWWRGTVGLPFR